MLLAPDEPAAVEVVNAGGRCDTVVVCDHASNRVPRRLAELGLDAAQLATHIAWDPGAATVARRLADRLDAPLVLSGYSRLVIDCNRPPHHPESIALHSAGVAIPGNQGLSSGERQTRIGEILKPYHDAIARLLADRGRRPTLLLSIHSFTPVLGNRPRPWHVGVSPGRDRRLAAPLRAALAAAGDLVVGDDEPYPVEDGIDYTIPEHGDRRGLPSVMIEIRQDRLEDAAAAAWGERIAAAWSRVRSSGPSSSV